MVHADRSWDFFRQQGFQGFKDIWPKPTSTAFKIIASFSAFEALLQLLLPGKHIEGSISPMGNRRVYKANGLSAYAVTLITYSGLWWCIPDREDEDESKVKWLELQEDVLSVIAEKLTIKDQILLAFVCRGWQSVYNEVRWIRHLRRPLPVLILPMEEDGDDDTTQICNLYSLAENKLCDFRLCLQTPHPAPATM